MTAAAGYDEPSALARALDRVGARWAMLVVRELAYGPKRFSDLRRGLGGISHTELTQRLAELEASQILRRTRLPAPSAATAYELTELGHGLQPTLVALTRWGSRLPAAATGDLSPDALRLALQAAYRPGSIPGTSSPDASSSSPDTPSTTPPHDVARVVVQLDDGVLEAGLGDRDLQWSTEISGDAGAMITTTGPVLHALVFTGAELGPAMASGKVRVEGDLGLVRSFLAAFGPAPADPLGEAVHQRDDPPPRTGEFSLS